MMKIEFVRVTDVTQIKQNRELATPVLGEADNWQC